MVAMETLEREYAHRRDNGVIQDKAFLESLVSVQRTLLIISDASPMTRQFIEETSDSGIYAKLENNYLLRKAAKNRSMH